MRRPGGVPASASGHIGWPNAENAMTSDAGESGGPEAESVGEPFTFRADGREISIPGAWRYPEGVYVPTASLAFLSEHLADRRSLEERLSQLEQKLRDADPACDHEVLKARALTYRISRLMDEGPEAMAEWLDNLYYNRPLLEVSAEADALSAQLHDYKARLLVTAMEQEVSDLGEQMERALTPCLDVHLADPAIAPLRLDRNRLLVRLYQRATALFIEAPADHPAAGVRKGDLIVNTAILKGEIDAAAALARASNRRSAPQ